MQQRQSKPDHATPRAPVIDRLPVVNAHGEKRCELKPNYGNVQSSQESPELRIAKTPEMENHYEGHLAITYRDEINERIVIVFEHFPSPGQILWIIIHHV